MTVLLLDYATRTDELPVALSASVDGTADFVTLFEYDAEGRLIDLRQTGQGASTVADKHVTLEYDQRGLLVKVIRYASLDTSALVAVSEYTYDDYGRLTGLVHYQNPAEPLAEYAWTYEGGAQTVQVLPSSTASLWYWRFRVVVA